MMKPLQNILAMLALCLGAGCMHSGAPIMNSENPLFTESELPLHFPPFDEIEDHHLREALERGMVEQLAEVRAIADNPEPATFDNTFVALEQSGALLGRASRVFYNLASADTNPEREKIRADMAPKLAAHGDAIGLDPALFERVSTVYRQREQLGLDPESLRLVELGYRDFVRAGAELAEEDKERLRSINADLARLGTRFSQNVREEVNARAIVVASKAELAGLSDNQVAAAALAANERELPGQYVIPLLNTTGQPALAQLENRALRQRIMETSISRGLDGEFDNRDILATTMLLRAEKAQLLGYPNHAAYRLEVQTAGSVAAVNNRLAALAPAAVANARAEAADLQTLIEAEGGEFELAAWDWPFYTEKVMAERYDFDEAQLKPYFEMDNVLQKGVFYAAELVYGLTFKPRPDLPVYHEDVKVWEVFDSDGSTLAFFIQDFYARESKRGGAWMNSYVSQSALTGDKPVVANHQNVPKPPEGEPTLLTWDEVNTMFHEFGHALHGMFSDVTYPSFSGTSVPRDFVEFPSMVNEMWAAWPAVLEHYALHYETGEPMPPELLEKVLSTSTFNQGFATTEYLAAALLDQAWHQLDPDEVPAAEEVEAFEAAALEKAGVNYAPVPPRYRSAYFSHIMGGYSAGYYAYIWSEVMDADTEQWFKAQPDNIRANGQHFRDTLLSRGGSADAMQLFRDFRGRDPEVRPLLLRRGLLKE